MSEKKYWQVPDDFEKLPAIEREKYFARVVESVGAGFENLKEHLNNIQESRDAKAKQEISDKFTQVISGLASKEDIHAVQASITTIMNTVVQQINNYLPRVDFDSYKSEKTKSDNKTEALLHVEISNVKENLEKVEKKISEKIKEYDRNLHPFNIFWRILIGAGAFAGVVYTILKAYEVIFN